MAAPGLGPHGLPVCRSGLRINGAVDYRRLVEAVAGALEYEPPGFPRRVVYTPQFCKTPLPGRGLAPPDPRLESEGYRLGELFTAPGWTLVDVDLADGSPRSVLRLLELLLGRGASGLMVYPTRRGVHIIVEGDYAPLSRTVRLGGAEARVEVKPCARFTCTAFYRTFSALRIDGRVLVANARYYVVLRASDYRVERVVEPGGSPASASDVERLLGIRLEPLGAGEGRAGPAPRVYGLEGVHGLVSDTPARLAPRPWYSNLAGPVVVEPRVLFEALRSVGGPLPPCIEAILGGPGEGHRFAHLVLLVAALSMAGFALRRGSLSDWCEALSHWGWRRSECMNKLRSLLVCRGDACVYGYGSRLLSEAAPLWRCDPARCPLAGGGAGGGVGGGCPGASVSPARAAGALGRWLFRVIIGYMLLGGAPWRR